VYNCHPNDNSSPSVGYPRRENGGSVLEKYFLPSIKYVGIDAVPVADVGNRLFFDQMQAEKPDFFLMGKLFTFVCHVHFLSLIYILTQIQEMSNSD